MIFMDIVFYFPVGYKRDYFITVIPTEVRSAPHIHPNIITMGPIDRAQWLRP